jgi:hypothetical protein
MQTLPTCLEPVVPFVGLEPVASWNPLWIQVHEYEAIAGDSLARGGWRRRLAPLFHAPAS